MADSFTQSEIGPHNYIKLPTALCSNKNKYTSSLHRWLVLKPKLICIFLSFLSAEAGPPKKSVGFSVRRDADKNG